MLGWEPAGPVAEVWISPVRSAAVFGLRLVFPSFGLRVALSGPRHYSSIVTAALQHTRPLPAKPGARLEEGDLDVQEFLRILAEIADQQAHIPGHSRQIVVQLRIGE